MSLIEGDIDALILSPRGSVHDFDLAFQLRYLKKLDKLGKSALSAYHKRVRSITFESSLS